MLSFLLFIFLRKRRWGENKALKLKVKTATGPTSSNRSKTETIRASRFLMRKCSKKNTVTHPVIMPFLPKVHSTIPTSLARGHLGRSYCNTERLPARGHRARRGTDLPSAGQWRSCTRAAPYPGGAALNGCSQVSQPVITLTLKTGKEKRTGEGRGNLYLRPQMSKAARLCLVPTLPATSAAGEEGAKSTVLTFLPKTFPTRCSGRLLPGLLFLESNYREKWDGSGPGASVHVNR